MKLFTKNAKLNYEVAMTSIGFGVLVGYIIVSFDLYRPYYESIFGSTCSYMIASGMSFAKNMSIHFNPREIMLEMTVYSIIATVISFIVLRAIVSFASRNVQNR